MTPEQLELAITHYLDGTLPAEEVAALDEILATDAQARVLLAEHEKLTALLRSQPLPEMDHAELARDFSAVVTGSVDEQSRLEDQKLNAILKSVSPLPSLKWDQLASQISASLDAELAAADEEDAKLDVVLMSTPMPELNWDKLAGHLSKAVAAEVGIQTREDETPEAVYRMGWVRTASRWAMAACVLGAAAVGIRMMQNRGTGPLPVPQTITKVAMVETPQAEPSNQPAVAEISIGPSKAYAEASDQELYRRGVATRSPVVIAVPVGSEDDADHSMDFE
jgi:hypothetical protein